MDLTSEWNSQLRRGLLEFCILSLIETSPRYGYEIVTKLAESPQLAAGEGTVYPLLRRLRKDGWLDTFWQESVSGPPRQYYRPTPLGQQVLRAMRQEWAQLVQAVNQFSEGGADPT